MRYSEEKRLERKREVERDGISGYLELPKLRWRRRRSTPARNFGAAWRRGDSYLRGSDAGDVRVFINEVLWSRGQENVSNRARFSGLIRTGKELVLG
jgi:hypothetical protein